MENIFVQFKNNGQNIGPPLSIPKSTNYTQLNSLINDLLNAVGESIILYHALIFLGRNSALFFLR